MSKNLNRRDVLTMGSALAAASGVALSMSGAEAQDEPSESSYTRLDTARALYPGSDESTFGLDAIATSEILGETLRERSEPFQGVADVELISALLELSRMGGDADLMGLLQSTDISDDISAKSRELLDLFVIPMNGVALGVFLQEAELRYFKASPEAVLVEKDGDRLVLTPFVAHSCSFMDWLSDLTGWF